MAAATAQETQYAIDMSMAEADDDIVDDSLRVMEQEDEEIDDEESIQVPLNDAPATVSNLHHSNVSDLHSVASSTEAHDDDIDDGDDEHVDVPPPPTDISKRIKQYHSAASPALSRSSHSKKSSSSPKTPNQQKKKMRRNQMSDSWISSHVGNRNSTPEIPPTVSDGDDEIASPIPSVHGRRKLKIPSWVSDNNSSKTPGPLSPRSAHSRRSVGSASRKSDLTSPSISRRRMRGRRAHGNSWIKTEDGDNNDDKTNNSIPSLKSRNTKSPVPGVGSPLVPSSIAYPGVFENEQVAALKDGSDDVYKTPISKKKFASALAAYVSQTPGSRSTRKSRSSFKDEQSVNSSDALFESDAELSSDDNLDDDAETLRRRLESKKDRIKRIRTKAKERMHNIQITYKEERDEWKTTSMELDRIKRERDRLLQDQAEERALLKESQDAAQKKQDDLNQIQKAMERNNMCKATGATASAKNALDLQSRIEAMVQENRRLQRENESLTQQKVVIKGDTKRMDLMFGEDDSETSFPMIFLKFLQATTGLQQEVTEQISAVIPDASFSSHDSITSFHHKSWEESQESLSAALQSSQHAAAIEKGIAQIQLNSERQLKALLRSKKEHEMKLENIAQSNAEETDSLSERIEELEKQITEAREEKERNSLANAQEINDWKLKHEKANELKAILEEKESEMHRLGGEFDDALRNSEASRMEMQQQLLAKINTLEDEKEETKAGFENISNELADARSELSSLKGRRASEQTEHNERVQGMQKEIDEWKTKHDQAQRSSDGLDEVRVILKERKEQVRSLNHDLRAMKKQLADKEDKEKKIDSLKVALSEAESQIALLETQREAETQELEQKMASFKAEAEKWEHEYDEVSGSQIILKGSLEHQEGRVNELEQEIDDLKVFLAEKDEELDALEDRIADMSHLEDIQETLEAEKERHATQMESLQADNLELEANLVEVRNQLKESESGAAEKSFKDLEETMDLVGKLQTELSQINVDHEALQLEMELLTKERIDLEATKEQYEDKIAKLEQQLESVSDVANDASPAKLKKENEVLQQALEKIAGEYQREIDSLQDACASLRTEDEKQKKEIEKLENDIMERSLKTASEAKEATVEALESSARKRNSQGWEDVDECFEHLHQSMSSLNVTSEQGENAQSMQELENKFQHLRETSEKQEAYLLETVRRQKVSIDSMFEDLVFARDQVKKFKTLVAQLESSQSSKDKRNSNSLIGTDTAGLDEPSTDARSIHGNGEANQSDMLESVLERQAPTKQRSGTGSRRLFGFANRRTNSELENSTEDPAAVAAALEEKCRALEEENQTLKSSLVKAQTQYKEETYKHKKAMEELQMANEAVTLKNIALIDAVDNTYDGSDRNMIVDMPDGGGPDDEDDSVSNSIDANQDKGPPETTHEPPSSSSPKIMRV
ncbi:MAG: hypothetical protein SGILL_002547 [Bacillariaceae sp.]